MSSSGLNLGRINSSFVLVALLKYSSYMELASLLGWWVGVWVGGMAGLLWLHGSRCALGARSVCFTPDTQKFGKRFWKILASKQVDLSLTIKSCIVLIGAIGLFFLIMGFRELFPLAIYEATMTLTLFL
jgi:hypothetical protein